MKFELWHMRNASVSLCLECCTTMRVVTSDLTDVTTRTRYKMRGHNNVVPAYRLQRNSFLLSRH